MATLATPLPGLLQVVTQINRLVALRHRGAHQSRTGGHVGTSNTVLVARSAQRQNGKHRAVSA